MDPAVLMESVKKFNEAVSSGYDPEFGRTVFNTHALIEDFGPYYACPRSPAVHHTMGGVRVDVDTPRAARGRLLDRRPVRCRRSNRAASMAPTVWAAMPLPTAWPTAASPV